MKTSNAGFAFRFPREAGGHPIRVCRSSGIVAVSGAVAASYATLVHLVVKPGGSACEVKVYDNATEATGTVIGWAVCGDTDPLGGHANIECEAINGLYLEIVSGTPEVCVWFRD